MTKPTLSALLRMMLVLGIWGNWSLVVGVANAEASREGSQTDGDFYKERADGWHWYEDPPPETEEEERLVPPPETEAGGEAGPAPLSAAWMRDMLPVLRDAAIDNPTNDNVSAYFYAQRIMMDKAQVFSDVAQQVVTSDPLLDENLRLPFASAAKVSFLQSANDAKKAIVNSLGEKAGFWFFYDQYCSHCQDQVRPINEFAKRHGLTVQVIHKNGETVPNLDPSIAVRRADGQFETLGINFTPAVMMVVPPDGYYLISQGFTAYTTLVDRVIAAANQYGLVSEEEFYAAVPTAKGVLRADRVPEMEAVNWNDTGEWLPFIRHQIAETYGIDMSGEE